MSLEEEAGAIGYGINVAIQKIEQILEESGREEFSASELKDILNKIKNNEL